MVKQISIKFEEWLVQQQNREDHIGDLARFPNMGNLVAKVSNRKKNEHKNWADVVIGINEPGFISVFNAAWREYVVAKQAVEVTAE